MDSAGESVTAFQETFAELAAAGKCRPADIEKHIEKWHTQYCGPLELHEYLGLTEEQYDRWLLNKEAIDSIVRKIQAHGKTVSASRRGIAAELLNAAEEALEGEDE